MDIFDDKEIFAKQINAFQIDKRRRRTEMENAARRLRERDEAATRAENAAAEARDRANREAADRDTRYQNELRDRANREAAADRARIDAANRDAATRQSEDIKRAGSGYRRREVGLNLDEPLAVGEPGITEQEAMRRAMDLGNRQLLDPMTNQATKRANIEDPITERYSL